MVGSVLGDPGGAGGKCRSVRNLEKIVIRVEVRDKAVAGIIPIDDVVIIAPGIPPGH